MVLSTLMGFLELLPFCNCYTCIVKHYRGNARNLCLLQSPSCCNNTCAFQAHRGRHATHFAENTHSMSITTATGPGTFRQGSTFRPSVPSGTVLKYCSGVSNIPSSTQCENLNSTCPLHTNVHQLRIFASLYVRFFWCHIVPRTTFTHSFCALPFHSTILTSLPRPMLQPSFHAGYTTHARL